MKKNAIVIAGIMCVAAGATSQAQTAKSDCDSVTSAQTEVISDPSVAAQHDPASGGYASGVSGSVSSSTDRNMHLSVGNYHADSSVRGGSNQARGFTQGSLDAEGIPHPMNPFQADSSLRGGSSMARGRERHNSYEPFSGLQDGDRIKADSSIRGGSNGARYSDRALHHSDYQSSNYQPLRSGDQSDWYILEIMPDSDMTDNETQFEYLDRTDVGQRSKPDSWTSDKGSKSSIESSANWNAGDDLLPDGTERSDFSNHNNDASIGGAATSESGKASSSSQLDYSSSSLSSPGSQKDLNSSPNLERDIRGEFNLYDQVDTSQPEPSDSGIAPSGSTDKFDSSLVTPQAQSSSSVSASISGESSGTKSLDQSLSSSAVGGPGSTETGVASSSGEGKYDPSSVSSASSETDLADKVKSILSRESTGIFGMTREEVDKNVQVTSHGGTVVLNGIVPSRKDKDMLEIRAREIAGVHKVDNQLTVSQRASVRDFERGRDLEDTTDQLRDLSHIQD